MSIQENHIIQMDSNKISLDGEKMLLNLIVNQEEDYITYSFSDNKFDTIWDIRFDNENNFIDAKRSVFSYQKEKYITIIYHKI